jgi:phosphoribosylaminoimidazole carboxylase (NCAIR synthetase)
MPAILKTTKLGYDGKGQWKFASHKDIELFIEKKSTDNSKSIYT